MPVPTIVRNVEHELLLEPLRLAGRGSGLTPAGDDILAGYSAGLTLFHGLTEEAAAMAELTAPRTTALSATLVGHAARGKLPEPAHALLERGDSRPLRRFGALLRPLFAARPVDGEP